jgi:protein TonB
MVPGGKKRPGIGGGLLLSALVHGSVLALVIVLASRPQAARPPVYRVDLVGAPPGPRQAGVVTPAPSPTAPSAASAASGAERAAPPEKALPSVKKAVAPPKATPSATPSRAAGANDAKATSKTAPAVTKAGSGKVGGKGADVANIKTEGIAFPFPGYLNNIVRQLTLSWSPRRVAATLVTEVKFVIRRDGSIAGIDIVKSSGDRLYDSEAAGAVEAVGATRGFGVLPKDWKDDALVVYFTFDYSLRP